MVDTPTLTIGGLPYGDNTFIVSCSKYKDWKYLRQGSTSEVVTTLPDYITQYGFHPLVYGTSVANINGQFDKKYTTPWHCAWDYTRKGTMYDPVLKGTLKEIVTTVTKNENTGLNEIKEVEREVQWSEIRVSTLPQQDFAYQLIPAGSGKILCDDENYYELFVNYDIPYPEYMTREYGTEARMVDSDYEKRVNCTVFRKRVFRSGDDSRRFYRYDTIQFNPFELDSRGRKKYTMKQLNASMKWKEYFLGKDALTIKTKEQDGVKLTDYYLDESKMPGLTSSDNYIAAAVLPGSLFSSIYRIQWRFVTKPNRLFLFHNFRETTFMREITGNDLKSGTFKFAISSAEEKRLLNSGRDWVVSMVHVDENGKCTFGGWNFNLLLSTLMQDTAR